MSKKSNSIIGLNIFFIFVTINCSCHKSNEPPALNIDYDTIIDIEGNQYKTVKIGDQVWMAENRFSVRCLKN